MRPAALVACAVIVVGCSAGEKQDLQAWMGEQARAMRGSVKPLPEIRPFPVVSYEGVTGDDPFRTGRMDVERRAASTGLRPDMDRRKEPLEAYPLESLSMVGVLVQGRNSHALISAGKSLHQVKIGNHMGQDFGVVTKISENEVTLKELVEDVHGDWVERTSTLTLQERQEAGK